MGIYEFVNKRLKKVVNLKSRFRADILFKQFNDVWTTYDDVLMEPWFIDNEIGNVIKKYNLTELPSYFDEGEAIYLNKKPKHHKYEMKYASNTFVAELTEMEAHVFKILLEIINCRHWSRYGIKKLKNKFKGLKI